MEVVEQCVPQLVFNITQASHAGEARRAAVYCAEQLSMGQADCGKVAIAVTEMASNIVKHASSGKIVLEHLSRNGSRGLRVLSIDKGPGIRDIDAAFRDGYSTAGTAGNGLGSVRRASSHFDIYSAPDRGTCVLAEFWPHKAAPPQPHHLSVGVIAVPIRGESVCGDGWAIKHTASTTLLMVVDGLGHGTFAAEAAREAQRVLIESTSCSPAAILRDCHDALRKTRGAAVAIAAINSDSQTLCFAGLGNISASLTQPQNSRGIASHNGTVGFQMHRVQEFSFPWHRESMLVMHSDGVGARWDLADYPGIWNRHPSIVAAVLYRDFVRERDDASVLVARNA